MKTEWHKIGMSMQGEEDIDTGSYQGLRRARTKETGKPLTEKEQKEAKELSEKVKSLISKMKH